MSQQTQCDSDLWWARPSRAQQWHCFAATTDESDPESLCGGWTDYGWRQIPHRDGIELVENLHCKECAHRAGMVVDDPRVDLQTTS
jgi:hypothetical protein